MEGAIVVIGATDGVMPQTKEHITLIKQLGIKDIVVRSQIRTLPSFPVSKSILFPPRSL